MTTIWSATPWNISDLTTGPETAYRMPQLVYVGPDAALAERNQEQERQIAALNGAADRFQRDLAAKRAELYDQRQRDKRLCYHISRVEAKRTRASFFNPEGA